MVCRSQRKRAYLRSSQGTSRVDGVRAAPTSPEDATQRQPGEAAPTTMAYGAFARPRRGDVEAPAEERRRKFERTGIAAAGLCIFLLVVAMFVNAHNRRTAAFVAETHSDVVLLACSGKNAPRSRTAELLDCDATRAALFRRVLKSNRRLTVAPAFIAHLTAPVRSFAKLSIMS